MKITFLGTANARGIPVYGCTCRICERARQNPFFRRHCACLLLELDGTTIAIDAGRQDLSDFVAPETLSGILLSHFHSDHCHGLHPFAWSRNARTKVYAPEPPPATSDFSKFQGSLEFEQVSHRTPFNLSSGKVTPVGLSHGCPALGYCIETKDARFAYISDTNGVPGDTLAFLKEWQPQALAIDSNDCGQVKTNPTHTNFDQILEVSSSLPNTHIYLIHLSDRSEAWLEENFQAQPKNIFTTRDHTVLELPSLTCRQPDELIIPGK